MVLPQVRNGILAIAVFTFIRGWEEYIFVFTFLIRNTNWTMSLYMYYVRDDVMGVDYGVVSAVGVFYLVPSLAPLRRRPALPDADVDRRREGLTRWRGSSSATSSSASATSSVIPG